ncbi:MAG TPA: ECF transporter S component [Bacilli bacterium]|nr:ECF transporter S component [Bacilli bacterium]
MKNKQIRMMAIDAMFIAILAIFAFVPSLGFIQLGVISFTTLPIIVFIGAYIFGWKRGLIYGTMFGLFSLLKAFSFPGTIDYYFINPLISVLPRAIFGLAAGLVATLLKKLPFKIHAWLIVMYVFVLSFLHSIMVIGMLGLLHPETWVVLAPILGSGALIEAASYSVIVPLVITALQPVIKRLNLDA